MLLLAIESSGLVASVAIMSEDKLIGEYTTNFKKTHSQTLLPMLDEVVRMTGISLDDVDAIAVSGGPGSFTGLRIGAATAKGLGLALDKPLIHVPTVDALAYNLFGTNQVICPIMDARRQQVYTGLYTFEGDAFKVLCQQKAVGIEEIVQEYEGEKMPFYHFDVYRIGDAEEMEEIGFEDYVYGQGVCLIEWANLIREILPEDFMGILIEKDMEKGFDYRRITLERGGVL